MTPSPAGAAAARLLAALVGAGVTDLVVCPGSRSQALALAAASLAERDEVQLHVRLDERDAGFLALGLARASGRPAAVIVTSGTAVANLHPAVLEAHHSDIPLIAITADRPSELQGRRANQTARQPGIFGDATRAMFDVEAPGQDLGDPERLARAAVSAALGVAGDGTVVGQPGPVQLNLAFRAPLSDALDAPPVTGAVIERPARAEVWIPSAPATVIVAGADAGPDAEALAHELGAPLIAEPSSGARFGRSLVIDARAALDQLADQVRRVIVLGHPTLSRAVTALLDRTDIEVLVVGREGQDNVRGNVLIGTPRAEFGGDIDRGWVRAWVMAGRPERGEDDAPDTELSRSDYARSEMQAGRRPVTRAALADAVWGHTWPHDALVLGASRLIRTLDGRAPGKAIRVFSNRGLSGIDGTIATAQGVATIVDREGRGGTTRALIGDLTLLHDVGGLWLPADEPRPRLQLVVGNDGGGAIFDLLEVAQSARRERFDRVQFVPQSVDLAALAGAYGWAYTRVEDRAGLERALSGGAPGIIDVRLARFEDDPAAG